MAWTCASPKRFFHSYPSLLEIDRWRLTLSVADRIECSIVVARGSRTDDDPLSLTQWNGRPDRGEKKVERPGCALRRVSIRPSTRRGMAWPNLEHMTRGPSPSTRCPQFPASCHVPPPPPRAGPQPSREPPPGPVHVHVGLALINPPCANPPRLGINNRPKLGAVAQRVRTTGGRTGDCD